MMCAEKAIVFDLDGTLADLYSVFNWLEKLRSYDATPYSAAKPIYKAEELIPLIVELKDRGFRIIVTSWLSKKSTKEYDAAVRKAKKEWLAEYGFPYDEIHLVKYGTPKTKCSRGKAKYQILVDDNVEVRSKWTLGATIDANENIIPLLKALLEEVA